MVKREIGANVYLLGAIDWDRRLFDALIPLPDGTSYNAYLVKGSEKTALLDTVDPKKTEVLLAQLDNIDNIDYIVVHHAEQDHSGSLPAVIKRFPKARVVTSKKAKGMLIDLLGIDESRFEILEDKMSLSLGNKTLEFIYTPWVHWPETIATYLKEDKILFTCDFFGSHLATSDLYADESKITEPAKRYFAEIMMPFRNFVRKNLEKLEDYDIDIIAPSHGPVHKNADFIINVYKEWAFAPPKNLVVLPYVSMHGSTRKMVDYFTDALIKRGVSVKRFDLTVVDIGKLATSLVDAATIVLATPTVLAGPHPIAAYAAFLANALKPKTEFASVIGSYGWGGKTVDILASMLSNLKIELFEPVLCKGLPKEDTFKALDVLAQTISDKHRERNLS